MVYDLLQPTFSSWPQTPTQRWGRWLYHTSPPVARHCQPFWNAPGMWKTACGKRPSLWLQRKSPWRLWALASVWSCCSRDWMTGQVGDLAQHSHDQQTTGWSCRTTLTQSANRRLVMSHNIHTVSKPQVGHVAQHSHNQQTTGWSCRTTLTQSANHRLVMSHNTHTISKPQVGHVAQHSHNQQTTGWSCRTTLTRSANRRLVTSHNTHTANHIWWPHTTLTQQITVGDLTQHSHNKSQVGRLTQHSHNKSQVGHLTQHSHNKSQIGRLTQHSHNKSQIGRQTTAIGRKSRQIRCRNRKWSSLCSQKLAAQCTVNVW